MVTTPPPEHDSDEYAEWSDTQLVGRAHSHGAMDLGAHAELLRRLIVRLQASEAVTTKQNERLAWLTIVLVVLTVLLLGLGVVQVLRC